MLETFLTVISSYVQPCTEYKHWEQLENYCSEQQLCETGRPVLSPLPLSASFTASTHPLLGSQLVISQNEYKHGSRAVTWDEVDACFNDNTDDFARADPCGARELFGMTLRFG